MVKAEKPLSFHTDCKATTNQPTAAPKKKQKKKKSVTKITISAAGDCTLGKVESFSDNSLEQKTDKKETVDLDQKGD